jgi:oleandomycin transport system ATP-binding protein
LDSVDLSVDRGSIVGLLGPNGAGKTTLVRILATLLRPTHGHAFVAGFDVARDPAAVRARIGLTGQFTALDEGLTGRENLILCGRLLRFSRADAAHRADQLLEEFALTDASTKVVHQYSGGMRRRLDLAASLVGRPEILFLDEPTTGLDPTSRAVLWKVVAQYPSQGMTVLLTTHHLEEADLLADRIVLLDRGRITAQGSSAELKRLVGGYAVAVTLADRGERDTAGQVLATNGLPSSTAADERLLYVPIETASQVLDVARGLDTASVHVADLRVETPTLDDVFLAMTGRAPTVNAEDGGGPERRGRRPARTGGRRR